MKKIIEKIKKIPVSQLHKHGIFYLRKRVVELISENNNNRLQHARQETLGVLELEAHSASVFHNGDPNTALTLFKDIQIRYPNRPTVALSIANILASLRRFDDSLSELENLIKLYPENIQAILTKGQILNALGRREEAVYAFKRAYKLEPTNINAISSIIEIGFDDVEKKALLLELIKLEPGSKETWLKYGEFIWNDETGSSTKSIQDGSFEDLALLSDLILEEEQRIEEQIQLLDEMCDLAETQNKRWARQIAANRHLLGYLDTVNIWAIYQNTQIHLRNRSLFSKLYKIETSFSRKSVYIPETIKTVFTDNGKIPLTESSINEGENQVEYRDIITDEDLHLFQEINSNYAGSDTLKNQKHSFLTIKSYAYPMDQSSRWMHEMLNDIDFIQNKNCAIVTNGNFYYESLLLEKTSNVTTIRTNEVDNRSKKLKSLSISQSEFEQNKYDLVLAVNFVEQAGLGLDGKIDPEGDFKIMSLFKKLISPGGLLVISLPVGLDHTFFNMTRIYGEIRLSNLLKGWTILKTIGFKDDLFFEPGTERPVFLLQSEKPVH